MQRRPSSEKHKFAHSSAHVGHFATCLEQQPPQSPSAAAAFPGKGPSHGGGGEGKLQQKNAWKRTPIVTGPNLVADQNAGSVKKKNRGQTTAVGGGGGGGRKGGVNSLDRQNDDSGLAEDDHDYTKIDIAKAYQSCLSKFNQMFPNELSLKNSFPSNCQKVGSSASIYVTEISSPNLFLGIENNKQLKQSFQSLKKHLEQCVEDNRNNRVGPTKHNTVTNGSFVCVNDPAEGLSRGFVVAIVEQVCDIFLIDWGYINTYQYSDVILLSHCATGFCRPLARLFEIAGSPADIPFPEGFTLPVLFRVKVMMVQNDKSDEKIVVKVKYKGRDLIDYYYEPALLQQVEQSTANQRSSLEWGTPKSNPSAVGGTAGQAGGGGGDESSSATNSVVEEWLVNTADEQFSHFDEGPPSPTDDEALANLMEEFELGDSVSAVVLHPTQPNHSNSANFGGGNTRLNAAVNSNRNQKSAGDNRTAIQGNVPVPQPSPNTVSISSKLNIKAGSVVQILISYVVLPTFFNFIPVNQTTNKFREQLRTILNKIVTSPTRQSLQPTADGNGIVNVAAGQFLAARIRDEVKRVTVKQGHSSLEKNHFLKLQDVDYGGEVVVHCSDVFIIPVSEMESVKSIPVLRCNGSMSGLHSNSPNRRWSPEQCQSFRQLTEHNVLDAVVARVTLSPQMSVPYYNFDLYCRHCPHYNNSISIADIMRAFDYAAAVATTTTTTTVTPSSS